MNTLKFLLLLAISGSIALAAGFGAGRVLPRSGGTVPVEKKPAIDIEKTGSPKASVVDPEQSRPEIAALKSAFESGGAERFFEELYATEDEAGRLLLLIESAGNFNSQQLEELLMFSLARFDLVGMDTLLDSDSAFLMEAWTDLDPAAALDFATQMDERHRDIALIALFQWFKKDRGAAEKRLKELKAQAPEDHAWRPWIFDYVTDMWATALQSESPEVALRLIREQDLSLDYSSLFESGAEINMAVVDELLRFDNMQRRETIASSLFDTWFRRDPEAALEGVARYLADPDTDRSERIGSPFNIIQLLANWTLTDPEAAMGSMGRIAEVFGEENAVEWIADTVANSNPDHALAILEQHWKKEPAELFMKAFHWPVVAEFRLGMLDRYLEAGGQLGPAFFGPDPSDPFNSYSVFLGILESDPVATTDWLLMHPEIILGAFKTGVPKTGDVPPPFEGITAANKEELARRSGALMGEALAGHDLDAAIERIREVPPGEMRDGFLEGLAGRGAYIDPQKTSAALQEFGDQAAEATVYLAAEWVEVDAHSGMAFAAGMGGEVFDQALRHFAHRDVSGALQWLADRDHPSFGEYVSDADIQMHWIEQDAFGGAEVVAALPAELATEAVPAYIGTWAHVAPEEAARYINETMEPGVVRDSSVVQLATAMTHNNLPQAIEWIQTIDDAGLRAEAIKALLLP